MIASRGDWEMFNQAELYEKLRTQILTITFTKKDGSRREMLCSNSTQFAPETTGSSAPREGLLTVWDIEAAGWRSIKVDSIIEVYNEVD